MKGPRENLSDASGKGSKERVVKLPHFDPNPSARFAYDVLTEAGVDYVLIGKVAMWAHLPEKEHTFTKDVDFAVRREAIAPLAAVLRKRGIEPRPLSIGGLGVRLEGIRVDFIDRREGGLHTLFEEAIRDARRRRTLADVGGARVLVVRAEYLVAMKVVAAEEKDQEDAVRLLRVLRRLDLNRTREILRKHGGAVGANLLDALARRAGRPDARPEYRNSG